MIKLMSCWMSALKANVSAMTPLVELRDAQTKTSVRGATDRDRRVRHRTQADLSPRAAARTKESA
mgnify:CR=1